VLVRISYILPPSRRTNSLKRKVICRGQRTPEMVVTEAKNSLDGTIEDGVFLSMLCRRGYHTSRREQDGPTHLRRKDQRRWGLKGTSPRVEIPDKLKIHVSKAGQRKS
jgi:hypothetical protein